MKTTVTIFIFLTILILVPVPSNALPRTISLEFNGVDMPPRYLIPHAKLKRPRIGVALSGGGARGLAQIGALQVLESHGIQVDFIVGVSMGAIIGGLYASGYSTTQLESIVNTINWDDIIIDTPPRETLFLGQKEERDRAIIQLRLHHLKPVIPPAFTAGQKLSSLLTDLTMRVPFQPNPNFDNLKIPFRALATDMISGRKVLIDNGNLAEAMKASATFPLVFAPVVKDSMLLVDGGLISNLPVDEVIEQADVDFVIAINTISKLHDRTVLHTPWKVADQVTSIMQQEKTKQQSQAADILIELDLPNRTSDNFLDIDSLIQAGHDEALRQLPKLISMLEDWHKAGRSNTPLNLRKMTFDESVSNVARDVISPGPIDSWSENDVYTMLEQLYNAGNYQNVTAQIVDSSITLQGQYNPTFKTISIKGNDALTDSLLLSQIRSESGTPINHEQGRKDLETIINAYRRHGFSLARIKSVQLKNDSLKICIDEGIISDIQVKGNQRTKDYVVLRDFPLHVGDRFNINRATEGIQNIHGSGLFTNVSFEIDTNNEQTTVIIKVIEKAFTVLRWSGRYDNDQKEKGFLECVDENVLGTADKLSFNVLYGLRHKGLNLKYRSDRIFKTFLTSEITTYQQKDNEYFYDQGKRIGEYNIERNGISVAVGQQLQRLGNLYFIARLTSVDQSAVEGEGFPIEKFELKTLALRSIVDTQDKFPFPTRGKYYHFFYEMSSGTFLNSQVSFFKIYSSLETYFTFLKRNTIHPKFSWGTSDMTTPFSEQFRLGGMHSFYGFYENEHIGRHFILSSLEYRFFFPWALAFDFYLSLRYDAGATWKNATDFKFHDMRQGIGASLSMTSPIGPLSIAFGRNNDGYNRAYFSVGHEF